MEGRCHTEWSQYWFCSHMTIKSLVWPYNSPRSGVTPVIRGWVRTVLTDACLQPHSPTRGLQPLRTAISWCSLCPFALSLKQGPSRPSAQWGTHPALQCQQDPVQHGTFLTCNGKVSERFLSMKCYFICYSKWSQITAHSLPTVPSDHKCTEVPFLFHATTNPLIPGTCKHKNKSKFQFLCFEKQSTNPQNSSTKPKTMHWNLTPKNILHFESIRVSPCED